MNNVLSRVVDIDINDVLPNRNQPRIILNEEDDLGLTDSIKEYGVLQPIIVRAIGDKYEIIAGERRYRASVLAGKPTVPAFVINMNDKESAEVALIENVQRKELSPIEEALSYKRILDLGYMTQEQLAKKIGKSQPAVANKIRLLNLSDEVQDALLENRISERHARSLLRIKNTNLQNKMLDRIINERLTVRKTDEEIEKLIKEEGEEKMNNNELNSMPQFQSFTNGNVQPMPQFDAFQNAEPVAPVAPAAPVQPVIEPQPATVSQFDMFANTSADDSTDGGANVLTPSVPQFDIFQNAEPAAPAAPAAPVQPVVEPQPAAIPQFDIFANAQPAAPAEPVAEPQTFNAYDGNIFEPVGAVENTASEPQTFNIFNDVAAPSVPQFDIFQNAEPVAPAAPAAPVQPVIEPVAPVAPVQPIVEPVQPVIEPVVEQPQEPIATAPVQESGMQEQQSISEPIIITDYNKQYDPVMPVQEVQPTQREFKDVIAAIRECAAKIESYGYKLDVDEFDLTNIYQAIFKIEKM